jgi:hypothetical protein
MATQTRYHLELQPRHHLHLRLSNNSPNVPRLSPRQSPNPPPPPLFCPPPTNPPLRSYTTATLTKPAQSTRARQLLRSNPPQRHLTASQNKQQSPPATRACRACPWLLARSRSRRGWRGFWGAEGYLVYPVSRQRGSVFVVIWSLVLV